jgi:hypothetical protein
LAEKKMSISTATNSAASGTIGARRLAESSRRNSRGREGRD